jgi:ABC-type sugar transport system permease subunit
MNINFAGKIVNAINQVFDLTWKSGVQTLMMLSALHSIPASMYEAADIEGATGWEKFWKITFPLVSPTTLLAVIYTIIDYFTDYSNGVIRMMERYVRQGRLEYSTTIGIAYFVLVMIIIFTVNALLSRRVFYQND